MEAGVKRGNQQLQVPVLRDFDIKTYLNKRPEQTKATKQDSQVVVCFCRAEHHPAWF
jgi:hypothetical protein